MSRTAKLVAVALAGLLALVMLIWLLNAPADAKPGPSPTAQPATAERMNDVAYFTTSTSETEGVPGGLSATGASTCRTRSYTVTAYNATGFLLYRFGASGYWCYSGGLVRSVRWNQWGAVGGQVWNLWRYDGVSSDVRTGAIGTKYVYRRVYGQFHYCVTWACKYAYPYVSLTLRGDGSSGAGGANGS